MAFETSKPFFIFTFEQIDLEMDHTPSPRKRIRTRSTNRVVRRPSSRAVSPSRTPAFSHSRGIKVTSHDRTKLRHPGAPPTSPASSYSPEPPLIPQEMPSVSPVNGGSKESTTAEFKISSKLVSFQKASRFTEQLDQVTANSLRRSEDLMKGEELARWREVDLEWRKYARNLHDEDRSFSLEKGVQVKSKCGDSVWTRPPDPNFKWNKENVFGEKEQKGPSNKRASIWSLSLSKLSPIQRPSFTASAPVSKHASWLLAPEAPAIQRRPRTATDSAVPTPLHEVILLQDLVTKPESETEVAPAPDTQCSRLSWIASIKNFITSKRRNSRLFSKRTSLDLGIALGCGDEYPGILGPKNERWEDIPEVPYIHPSPHEPVDMTSAPGADEDQRMSLPPPAAGQWLAGHI